MAPTENTPPAYGRQACLADRQGDEATRQSLQGNKQIASKGTPSVFSCVEATFPSLGEGAYY
ncbi:MAG: hypothetical protein RIM68_11420 [Arenibacter sp.]